MTDKIVIFGEWESLAKDDWMNDAEEGLVASLANDLRGSTQVAQDPRR